MGCFLSREISTAEIQNEPSTVFNELSSLPINLQQLLKQPGEYISFNFFFKKQKQQNCFARKIQSQQVIL